MSQFDKLLMKLLRGTSDASFAFDDLAVHSWKPRLRRAYPRQPSHVRPGIPELINIQRLGKDAKAYQVRDVRDLIIRYRLAGEPDE